MYETFEFSVVVESYNITIDRGHSLFFAKGTHAGV